MNHFCLQAALLVSLLSGVFGQSVRSIVPWIPIDKEIELGMGQELLTSHRPAIEKKPPPFGAGGENTDEVYYEHINGAYIEYRLLGGKLAAVSWADRRASDIESTTTKRAQLESLHGDPNLIETARMDDSGGLAKVLKEAYKAHGPYSIRFVSTSQRMEVTVFDADIFREAGEDIGNITYAEALSAIASLPGEHPVRESRIIDFVAESRDAESIDMINGAGRSESPRNERSQPGVNGSGGVENESSDSLSMNTPALEPRQVAAPARQSGEGSEMNTASSIVIAACAIGLVSMAVLVGAVLKRGWRPKS